MANFDDLKLSVEALSGGKNTVILDDIGMPSIMVRFPKFYVDDVIAGAPHTPHHAFIVNSVDKSEVNLSKYQNIVMNGRAYSLPYKDPKTYVNFDQALSYCYAKGNGWHLMSNAEWAAVSLWCKKNNFMPRGNNNYGKDISAPHEKGVVTYMSDENPGRVATGSGPAGWAHDNTNEGIFDLNGNVWEWVSGMRLNEGEIQIIENNNAAILNTDHSVGSAAWRAVLQDGTLMAPGTADTLKYDATNADGSGAAKLSTAIVNRSDGSKYTSSTFETMAAEAGVTVPTLLKALGLYPLDASHGGDNIYVNNFGERLLRRGGYWSDGDAAGVFALYLLNPRAYSDYYIGFRAAFVSL